MRDWQRRALHAGISRAGADVLNLEEICKILKCEVLVGENLNQVEAEGICAADLMSDVLAFTKHVRMTYDAGSQNWKSGSHVLE